MPGQAAEGRRAGSREGENRSASAGFTGEGAQVVGNALEVAFPRHDHEQGSVRGEQGHEEAGGAEGARELGPTLVEARPDLEEQGRTTEGIEPAHVPGSLRGGCQLLRDA